ncbi:MAG TPA: hypothetical protein VH375_01975, partial [Rhodanobacteraceae bacterium]
MDDSPEKRSWFEELKRRRMFRAMGAYCVAAWLLLQIANVTFPPLGLPDWWQRALIITLVVLAVPVMVLSWLYDVTAHGVVRTTSVPAGSPSSAAQPSSGAEVVAGLVGAGAPAITDIASQHGPSVAVLPFTDLSAEKDQDWFCDGLAEEIIDALVCVRHLRVASRTASFRYRDGNVDPREIGRQLRVGAILEGSVRRAGERVRITAQLIDATSDSHLWSETYDREMKDVFAIQDDIARSIAEALKVALGPKERRALQNVATADVQAYDFYLKGRKYLHAFTRRDFRNAVSMFERAIELDPRYSLAYAGKADAYSMLYRYGEATPENLRLA